MRLEFEEDMRALYYYKTDNIDALKSVSQLCNAFAKLHNTDYRSVPFMTFEEMIDLNGVKIIDRRDNVNKY